MSWRNDDTGDGLPIGLPQQEPEACPDGTPQGGAAGEPAGDELKSLVKQILEEQKKTNAKLEETQKQLVEVNKKLDEANKKIDRLESIVQSHDDYTKGVQCRDEEKIAHTTQVFLCWLDKHHQEKWESGVIKCVKNIEGGKIVFHHRCLTKFVRLLFSCMANSWCNKKKELHAHIVKNCMQTVDGKNKPIGDIHSIIGRF